MKIKIGDRVRFLNAVGGGTVTKIMKDTVTVLSDDDDFEYPTLISEIIKIEQETPAESTPPKPQIETVAEVEEEDDETIEDIVAGNDELKLFLGFVPQDDRDPTNCDLDVYVINDSNFHIYYTYLLPSSAGEYEYKKSGKIGPNTKWHIDTIERNELSKLNEVLLEALPYRRGSYKPMKPLQKFVKLQSVWFFKIGKYKTNDFFHEDAIIYEVTEDDFKKQVDRISPEDVQRVIRKQQQQNKVADKSEASKAKRSRFPEEKIIDLHIHELIDDEAGLSNGEILQIQIDKFEQELVELSKTPTKRVVFIHGVGNGRLKHDLRKKLERKYSKFRFQDASFAEYGWGATLVFLK